jgi:carbamoyltransferase
MPATNKTTNKTTNKMTVVLGVSAYYHDSAASIVVNGQVVAAAQEERFSRKKHDSSFPENAIKYCLLEAGVELTDLSSIVFYDKPLLKFERLLETYLSYAPKGFRSFSMAMPVWLKEKLLLKSLLRKELKALANCHVNELPKLLFTEHHQSHAASAFFPSPFEKAAVLCLDGVGEWATTSVWQGQGRKLAPLWELNFPHSLGLLYSAFTYYCGFKVNSGEYKLMGLAPYGEPKYVDDIYRHLIDVKEDGTFWLNMDYFSYPVGLVMTSPEFHRLFGGRPRKPESDITQKEMDLARSIQQVTEEVVLKIANTIYLETGNSNLCLAGGVALNCVANGRLISESKFSSIWIQPAAGDAGGALGAALQASYQYHDSERLVDGSSDNMQGSYLGPQVTDNQASETLDSLGAVYQRYSDGDLYSTTAGLLGQGNVVAWYQGRMEFGPRALGNRSILGDPRDINMQSNMNLKIKFRESFRPFAPSILAERVNEVFEFDGKSSYMLAVAKIQISKRVTPENTSTSAEGLQKLGILRSKFPAITHVDYSARLQTVHTNTNPKFHALLTEFDRLTGCPLLINTSFNVRGEPIVNTPEQAYTCFMRSNIDYLVIGNLVISKRDQPERQNDDNWRQEFELD